MKRRRKTKARAPNRSTDERRALGIEGCPFVSMPVEWQREWVEWAKRRVLEAVELEKSRPNVISMLLDGPATQTPEPPKPTP